MNKPVILLAFANEQEGKRYLRDLPEELRRLQTILEGAERKGLCELVVRHNVTLDQIFDAFTEYRDRVAIFHYGGHASSDGLFLESTRLEGAVAHAEGLARFLGQRRNLELVFLNGCSTRAQTAGLLEAGISAVIATARSIEDTVALEFAAAFYSELAAGATLRAAYEAARGRVLASRGSARSAYCRTRDLVAMTAPTLEIGADHADNFGFPWELRLAPGAELEGRWSLPEAVGDLLFGLPTPLVDSWPESPYLGLRPFTRAEASVFFGRGKAIRELYNLVTDPGTRPVILYYGPTGAGKSSVLAAGLLPRLELDHEVRYLRRNPDLGLLGTLRQGLGVGGASNEKAPGLAEAWLACEPPDRPLIVVLDQAEEAFTDPRAASSTEALAPDLEEPVRDGEAEFGNLLQALRKSFQGPDAALRPKGKLILGFRNEWLDRVQQAFTAAKLGWEPMPLKPLDEAGIIEAIEGPTRDSALARRYQLSISPGVSSSIASDLRADTGSAVAPTLQFLLTKMWACAGGSEARVFDLDMYRALQQGGYQLGAMLREGLEAVSEEVRASGLALDVLEFHTTEFDTAAQRSRAELEARYPHRRDKLDALLRTLEEKYLLIGTEVKGPASARHHHASRLGHDTLAPVVRKEFLDSAAPGQRARRLLENRAREWKDGGCGHPLDGADLATVESGAPGMRSWTADETRLVEASRQTEAQRRASELEKKARLRKAEAGKRLETRRRLKQKTIFMWAYAMAACLLAAALFNLVRNAARVREEHLIEDTRHILAWCNSEEVAKKPQQRLILAVDAKNSVSEHRSDPAWAGVVSEADAIFEDAWSSIQGECLFRQPDAITALAYLPGQCLFTGSVSGKLRVWILSNLKSTPTSIQAHDDREICSLVLSPDRDRLVSAGRDGKLKVWRVESDGGLGPEPVASSPPSLVHKKGDSISLLFMNRDTVISASKDKIYFWDLKDSSQKKPLTLPEPSQGLATPQIMALVLAKVDGDQLLASIGPSGSRPRICVWSGDGKGNWNPLNEPQPLERAVLAMAIVESSLIVADEGGSIREYFLSDLSGGPTHQGHDGPVRVLVPLSEDRRNFLSGGDDHTIRLWCIGEANPNPNKVLHGHEDGITAGVLDKEGYLLTGSRDCSVRRWDLKDERRSGEPGKLGQAANVVGRNLTREEWNRFFPGKEWHPTFSGLQE